ncbi:PEP/pyruvate-binding domain-containing protein [Lentzea aerocolonigenes]|uniref:PEP/pyruvate-binding domain-containing protein n=1 Tax=Lentzea aerocolonigenes TaxID=68170 RepID=UPI000AC9C7A0|nr:PEP/pyruvate-binding domain-containing protein [Lentzea aerocolonigenes]
MQEPALVGERLTLSAFTQLSGTLSGYRFVKLVVDRETGLIHFMDSRENLFHVRYIAAHILHMPPDELERRLDEINFEVYHRVDRRFCLGILALHDHRFFSLETVEADTMTAEMLQYFYDEVHANVDQSVPILLKPANHLQESHVANIPKDVLPRILSHELFSTNSFVPLNPGTAEGRLRVFRTEQEYEENQLAWHDIIVMAKVPDDIPRLTGVVNAEHTTPLSHTNVLASGWGIPNAIQLQALDTLAHLDGRWVRYTVDPGATGIGVEPIERPDTREPSWLATRVTMDEPDLDDDKIANLQDLRWRDSTRYGTKAANLGELNEVARNGSTRWLGFYRIPRPPRENLLPYLEQLLGTPDLDRGARNLFRDHIRIPRGIALPFSLHQRFLEASPRLQQAIGKLKLALELDAPQTDAQCVELQHLIRTAKFPDALLTEIDDAIIKHLSGVSTFVVRSSSNAEDLAGFSAAGIYESVTHVSDARGILGSVKKVWASLVNDRSTRLREQAGISLDDAYMGVIIQEQVPSDRGGVMVTTNPLNRNDFRNVYINVASKVTDVVDGEAQPSQYLFNTVEGGGRTVALGESDVDEATKQQLQRLATAGRLLQSHFSPDYTFGQPVDIEWAADSHHVHLLQLRPYA